MKLVFLILTVLLIPYNNFAQEKTEATQIAQIINIDEIFLAKGAIFPESIWYPGKDAKDKERFTPSKQDVRLAERVILNSLCTKAGWDTLKWAPKNSTVIMDYYRQYFGYIESDGSKIIVIYYMNVIENPILFKDWDKDCSIGAGDEYYKNSHLEWVNISKEERLFK